MWFSRAVNRSSAMIVLLVRPTDNLIIFGKFGPKLSKKLSLRTRADRCEPCQKVVSRRLLLIKQKGKVSAALKQCLNEARTDGNITMESKCD